MQPIKNGRSVLVGGCELDCGYLDGALRSLGFMVEHARDREQILNRLKTPGCEVAGVILDAVAPDDGFETLRDIRSMDSQLPVIVVSSRTSTVDIVAAIKSGATDFLSKPVRHEDLVTVLTRALETYETEHISVPRSGNWTKFLAGGDPRMREIQAHAAQIGWSDVPVLIQGETGSGKEVLARELHSRSRRASKPFLKLNCAALPSELVESELFGYERGAFTGAFQKKAGMFELADGGTLLLDEIGDMDIRLQAKLLQVLQDHEFRRIGGKETVKVDVRIIAATHRDLEKAIQDRTFREDLYYRLNVVNLQVPPLRERREDIVPIAEFLIRKHAPQGTPIPKIALELKQVMLTYHWPGNVRELENYMRKLIIFQDCATLVREISARTIRKQPMPFRSPDDGDSVTEKIKGVSALEQATRAKERAEVEAIISALNSTHWNRKQAAVILKIDYKSLLYKMKKLGIDNSPISLSERTELPRHEAKAVNGNPGYQ